MKAILDLPVTLSRRVDRLARRWKVEHGLDRVPVREGGGSGGGCPSPCDFAP